MELPNPRPLLRPVSLRTFSRMRRRALSPHLWCRLEPNWRAEKSWLYLETPAIETESQLKKKFDARDNKNVVDRLPRLMSVLPTHQDGRLLRQKWLVSNVPCLTSSQTACGVASSSLTVNFGFLLALPTSPCHVHVLPMRWHL